jgi:hypothetical protein
MTFAFSNAFVWIKICLKSVCSLISQGKDCKEWMRGREEERESGVRWETGEKGEREFMKSRNAH